MSSRTIDAVAAVLARHDADHEGGYAAVADLRAHLASVGPAQRNAALAQILRLVLEKDRTWRGVALEVLVQERATEAAQAIQASLATVEDDSWQTELVRALLLMGYGARKAELREYVSNRVRALRGGDLTLIAAFANIDPGGSAELAAQFWIAMHGVGKAEDFVAYLPSLLINYSKVRPQLVGDFLRLVRRTGPSEGTDELAVAVKTYLEKPWATKQLGSDAWEWMRRAVAELDVSTN